MNQWLFTIDALDESDAPVTLRFSEGEFIDGTGNEYLPRILKPALVYVGASDGGLLPVLNGSSVGDIEIANKDGALFGLTDYALDGRVAVISFVDQAGTISEYFRGTISKFAESDGSIIFSLKSRQDSLTDNLPLSIYAGDNVGAAGLEGTDEDIGGDFKPKVLGYCQVLTPKLVNASLLIYQVSDRDDCRITAVYDDGVRLINFRTSGSHAIGVTSIAINSGLGAIANNAQIMFSNHTTIYSVTTGAESGGSLVLSSGLTAAVPPLSAVEMLHFYTDASALQYTDYYVALDAFTGDLSISITGGTGAINSGDWVVFDNHDKFYQVDAGLSSGIITLLSGLKVDVLSGVYLQVIGAAHPALWGGYQGYFRLGVTPVGTITCDAVSIDGGNIIHKAGDCFREVATLAGLTMDTASVSALNAAGTLGLAINSRAAIKEFFDRIIKSVAGYYYFSGVTLYADLLPVPAVSTVFTLEDWQIKSISRTAVGLGSNGWPIKAVNAQYDKIETVQSTFAGSISVARRERLLKPFRELLTPNTVAAARYLLAEQLELESLLRSKASITSVSNRVLDIAAVSRHVINIEAYFEGIPAFQMGDTIQVVTPRLGYQDGRLVVIMGYSVDTKRGLLAFRCYG